MASGASELPLLSSYSHLGFPRVSRLSYSTVLSSGMDSSSVSSRFVSQNDVEEARKRRNEQWKAAYARSAFHLTIVQEVQADSPNLDSAKSRLHHLPKKYLTAGASQR